MRFKHCCLISLLTIACFISQGCDNSQTPAGDSAQQAASQQEDMEQQEIAKYNLYVETANSFSYSQAEQLQKHRYYMQQQKKDGDYEYYFVSDGNVMKSVAANLDKARAMKPEIKDLDAPARELSRTLHEAVPLVSELEDYASAKGALSDGGKKALENEAQYVALISAVAKAQDSFTTAIEKRDNEILRKTFANAEKGSPEYYRSGIALYSGAAMAAAADYFNGWQAQQPSEEAKNNFKQALDKLAEMGTGCASLKTSVNWLVSTGRTSIREGDRGIYRDRPNMLFKGSSLKDARQRLDSAYSNVISDLNSYGCGVRR